MSKRAFVKTGKQLIKIGGGRIPIVPLDQTEGIRQVVSAYLDYRQVAEREDTKREEIRAWRDKTFAEIEVMRDILMTALDRSFDERREVLHKLFGFVDDAIERNDTQALDSALQAVARVVTSSPLDALSTVKGVRTMLSSPEKEVEF